jgi:uncharacterized protein (DUF1778 family)
LHYGTLPDDYEVISMELEAKIDLRLTAEEKQDIQARAAAEGMTVGRTA